MKKIYYIILIISTLISFSDDLQAQSVASDIVFQIAVNTDVQNNTINLQWNTLPNVNGYKVYKKMKGASAFTFLANRTHSQTNYTDNSITVGQAYEYAVFADHTNQITGYVCAGIDIAAKHSQGNLLLVIDSNYIVPASAEIDLFKKDLIKEGWKVFIQYAGREESPTVVKQRILTCHNIGALEGVILLGHIPVPYSGIIAPDAHSDHVGAWPADVYYGDMCTPQNSTWQDAVLVNTSASKVRNHQNIGDGKFDVSSLAYSNSPKIFVGRVDVENMTAISSNDVMLFKQYINKNHAYRSGAHKFKKQGLIDDNFGYFYGEAFAQNGWRNMSALLGPDSIKAGDFMTDLKTDSYLWSYACGPGWNGGANGVGTTNNFNSNQLESVFTMLYGSYFGDWDAQNNFLRAPIASPSSTLVSIWAGRPNWFLHTMAMGDPIGYSFLNTVDNVGEYMPKGYANAQVHQSIQGDPTLKMYMYEAPTNLEAFELNNGSEVKLEWQASVDPATVGYYVYRASTIDGDFQLLNTTPVNGLTFSDTNPLPSNSNLSSTAYMVRAVKLEQTVTGTFYNLSPGELVEGFSANAPLPVTVTDFYGNANENQTNTLNWEVESEENIEHYEIERSDNAVDFISIGKQSAQADEGGRWTYRFDDDTPKENNYYRLKIADRNGTISYHSKIVRLQQKKVDGLVATLFPNPATRTINLTLPIGEPNEAVNILIYDLQGRVVLNKMEITDTNNPTLKIAIDDLAAGQYILRYKKETSFEMNNIKFVKLQ